MEGIGVDRRIDTFFMITASEAYCVVGRFDIAVSIEILIH
jgi:hypothetical protein